MEIRKSILEQNGYTNIVKVYLGFNSKKEFFVYEFDFISEKGLNLLHEKYSLSGEILESLLSILRFNLQFYLEQRLIEFEKYSLTESSQSILRIIDRQIKENEVINSIKPKNNDLFTSICLLMDYGVNKNISNINFLLCEEGKATLPFTKHNTLALKIFEVLDYVCTSKYIDYLYNLKVQIQKQKNIEKSINNISSDKKKTHISLNDYFKMDNADKKNLFLADLKETFSLEYGKSIRALIEVLKEENILHIPNRKNKPFHQDLSTYFERNIGSYNSLFDQSVVIVDYDKNFIREKLSNLLTKHELN